MTGFHRSFVFGPMFSPGVVEVPRRRRVAAHRYRFVTRADVLGARPVAHRLGPIDSREQNAFSPAPVSTAQRTSSLWRMPRHTAFNSACMAKLKALCTSGRFIVTQATPSISSYSSVSKFGHSAMLRRAQAGVRGHDPGWTTTGGDPSACRESRTCPVFLRANAGCRIMLAEVSHRSAPVGSGRGRGGRRGQQWQRVGPAGRGRSPGLRALTPTESGRRRASANCSPGQYREDPRRPHDERVASTGNAGYDPEGFQ